MELESMLNHVYEVAKSNGGYLTIREAARSCSQRFGQLLDNENNNGNSCNNNCNNSNSYKNIGNKGNKNKRNDSCSSSDSQVSCCSQSSVASVGGGASGSGGSCGTNNNTRINDIAEAGEKKLKSIIKSSNMFKLNGNVLFVNTKMQPIQVKTHLTNRSHLMELRRNSLPELVAENEQPTKTSTQEFKHDDIDSMANFIGRISNMTSSVVRSVNNFKDSIYKHHLQFAGDNNEDQLLEMPTNQSISCTRLSKSLDKSNGCDILTSKIPRSHSLDDCEAIAEEHPSKPSCDRPPSYLATPSAFNILPGSSWSDVEYYSKMYRNSDRLVAIMKNFETDVQMAMDRLIKQVRSELDSMLVDLHRPANKNLGEGTVYCVHKKWGIIDLGNHDHVFFDMSIMLGHVDDLRNHFQVGEVLGFEAVRAQKSSRANWRAIRVWKVDKIDSHQNHQNNLMKNVIHDRIYNRFSENESSKGNSPDASPGRWKKKLSNPLSKAITHDSATSSGHKSVCESKHTKPAIFNHPPLIAKTSLPMNDNEIRLIPSRFLTPPVSKKANQVPQGVKIAADGITDNPNHKISNPLQIITQIQRDSGTESGNSSPDAVHKSDGRLKSREDKQKDNNNVYCQTENHV